MGVTSKSPRLKVRSTVSMEKLPGTVHNLTRSSSCLSRASTNAGSGQGRINRPSQSPNLGFLHDGKILISKRICMLGGCKTLGFTGTLNVSNLSLIARKVKR